MLTFSLSLWETAWDFAKGHGSIIVQRRRPSFAFKRYLYVREWHCYVPDRLPFDTRESKREREREENVTNSRSWAFKSSYWQKRVNYMYIDRTYSPSYEYSVSLYLSLFFLFSIIRYLIIMNILEKKNRVLILVRTIREVYKKKKGYINTRKRRRGRRKRNSTG